MYILRLRLLFPWHSVKFGRIDGMMGCEIIIVCEILGRELITFQIFEAPEQGPDCNVEFTVCKTKSLAMIIALWKWAG
jgi:hypothetical protein